MSVATDLKASADRLTTLTPQIVAAIQSANNSVPVTEIQPSIDQLKASLDQIQAAFPAPPA